MRQGLFVVFVLTVVGAVMYWLVTLPLPAEMIHGDLVTMRNLAERHRELLTLKYPSAEEIRNIFHKQMGTGRRVEIAQKIHQQSGWPWSIKIWRGPDSTRLWLGAYGPSGALIDSSHNLKESRKGK